MVTKTSFWGAKLLVGLSCILSMAGGLRAQTVAVNISGTLQGILSGSGWVTIGGTYQSGLTATGPQFSYCVIHYTGGGGTGATAKVFLNATNTINSQTIGSSSLLTFGSGYSDTNPPTSATVSNGTATNCMGTATLTGVIVDDPDKLNNTSFTATANLPVNVPYNSASASYTGLTLTFYASIGTLTCNNATVTVTSGGGAGDSVAVSNCTFMAESTTFASNLALPPGSVLSPSVPLPFTASFSPPASSATYTPGAGSPFQNDRTTLGIKGMVTNSGCSGCFAPSLNPTSLTFSAVVGSGTQSQPVTVGTGGSTETYALTTSASWLTVSPTGGSTGTPFNVIVNPAGLTASATPYTGTVNFYTADSATPQTVSVSLTVTPPAFTIQATPLSTFNSVNSSAPSTQSLTITTSNSSQVAFTASASSTGNWLSVPAGGTTGTPITVSANPSVGPGAYTGGSITITAAGATNSPLTINNISFNVTTVPTPAALSFSGTVGGGNPPTQPLNVTANGPNVTYTAAVTSGSWLSVSPGSGTTGTGQTVSVNTSGLSANTYNGNIQITPAGGAPINVGVTLTLTSLPSMVPGSPSLTLNYTPGSSPSQTLAITSSSSTAINYTAAANTSSGGNWLQVSPGSGTTGSTTETVSINTSVASTLATGTYSGAVVFTCSPTTSCANASGQLSVPVTLTVKATLTPAPSSLSYSYIIGGSAPASIPIGVASNGGAITYTATAATTSGGNWLAVSPASATTPTGVTASVNSSALTGLGAGTYSGTITLTSTGASNSPVVIPATLVVTSALVIPTSSFAFAYQIGGSTPSSQTLTVDSSGAPGSQLSFTATAATTSGGNWLTVSAPTGSTPQNLTVSTVASVLSGYSAGATYNGTITITSAQASNSPQVIPVTLTVSVLPSLTTAPSSLTFNFTTGGSVPGSQAVTIGSSGSALSSVTSTPTVPWLSVSQNTTTTPVTMTVSLVQSALTGLSAGPHSGAITINATGAAAAVNYPVTLNVSAQPTLTVGPSSLTFSGQVNGVNPAAQILSAASTNGSVNFTATPATTSGGNWLSVTPTSGATNASLQVSVNTSGLGVGNYSGSITVTAAGATGSPAVIPVSLSVTSMPVLIATPSLLSFSYTTGAAAPAGQAVAVTTSNNTSAAYTLSASTLSGGNWLTFTPAGGASPSSFVASIVPGSLTAGTYNGTITVSAPGFTSTSVGVTLVVTQAKATIQVTGGTLFILPNTAAPITSTLAISASDGSAQAFTIAQGASPNHWLTLSPTSGNTPANVTLTINPAGLIPGIYTIPVTVTMPALPVPTKTIQLQLTVSGSNLVATPNMLTFTYQPGLPLPAAQTVSLTTVSGGTVALASVGPDVSWITVSQATSAPAMLQVSISPGLLAPGTYTGAVLVKGVGSPDASLEIPVTLTVNAAPLLTATPATLAFDYQIGGTTPAAQSFALASGNVSVNFTTTGPGSWLQVSPQHGTTPTSVMVTANPAGLPPGTYGGTIKITVTNAASTLAVPVTLTISGAPQFTFSPSQLAFAAATNTSAPAPQTVTVTSASGGPLTFTAAAGSTWLGVTPTSGTTPAMLTVTANPAGLANGTYNGTINVTQAGSAVPQMLLVSLQVGTVTPTIAGVINAASGVIGTVSPGMAVSIFGANLGPETGVAYTPPSESGTVATTLAGTQVLFDGVAVPLLFTMNGQVNALAPFELSGKTTTVVQVKYNGLTSAGMNLTVAQAEPGLFTANGTGKGEGAILNQDNSINSASNPAAAGSAIQLFGTGGGLTNPPSVDGGLNPISTTGVLTMPVTATVGGKPANVFYAGPAPGLVAGIFQVDLTLPSGIPSGNVPVVVTISCPPFPQVVPAGCSGLPGGFTSSSQTTVTVAVQ